MFTVAEEISNHPWANLTAKASGFKPVYARYDAETQTMEVRYPPEGDAEIVEGLTNINAARKKLASLVCQASRFVFNENY